MCLIFSLVPSKNTPTREIETKKANNFAKLQFLNDKIEKIVFCYQNCSDLL